MANQDAIALDAFREQRLADVRAGQPSTVELGRHFAHKLIGQWADAGDASSDLIYCDRSGDGGIDVAYLDRGDDDGGAEGNVAGQSWFEDWEANDGGDQDA